MRKEDIMDEENHHHPINQVLEVSLIALSFMLAVNLLQKAAFYSESEESSQ